MITRVLDFCPKVLPDCLLLWYRNRAPFRIPMLGVQEEIEGLNETKPGECPLNQCPFSTQIMKLIVNKSVSCFSDGKEERKEETKNIFSGDGRKKEATKIFSNHFVLVSVVATSLLLPLIIIILVYCCYSR